MKCSDLGGGCDFEATGEDAEEIKIALFEHAATEHPEEFNVMTDEERDAAAKKIDVFVEAQE